MSLDIEKKLITLLFRCLYENIKDIPFTATAVYCNGKWFWWSSICEDILAEYGRNDAEMVDEEVEILAWQPLPEPYEESEG